MWKEMGRGDLYTGAKLGVKAPDMVANSTTLASQKRPTVSRNRPGHTAPRSSRERLDTVEAGSFKGRSHGLSYGLTKPWPDGPSECSVDHATVRHRCGSECHYWGHIFVCFNLAVPSEIETGLSLCDPRPGRREQRQCTSIGEHRKSTETNPRCWRYRSRISATREARCMRPAPRMR
jgi:hypothetical protein